MLALAPAAVAGGFGLSARLPTGHPNPKAKGAALLVQAEGCHGPGATVTATAEGIVNGRRRSVPLRLTKVATDSTGVITYAVARQWPTRGVWVLALTGVSRAAAPAGKGEAVTCRALLELGSNGRIPAAGGDGQHLPLRYISGEAKEIRTALRTLAARPNRKTAITRSAR